MSNLLSTNFWFNQYPDALIPSMAKLIIVIIAIFLLASLAFYILKKGKGFYKILYRKFFTFFIVNAIIGAILFFFCQQMVPFLSARIWFLFWVIGMLIWLIFIVRYAKKLPAKKKQAEVQEKFKKYLP